MLNFTPVTADAMTVMRPYYENCTYRLCEYSAGVKYMWRGHLHSEYAFTDGCLVIRNCIDGVPQFDYPIPGPEGDVDAALATIEDHCRRKGVRPIFSVVPESEAGKLALRWPRVIITNERAWKDYLYHAEDLAHFAGRHYSGQRNHINKFNKEHPGAEFIPLTAENADLLAAFWADYDREFQKQSPEAKRELTLAQDLFTYLGTGMFRAGGILWEGRLLAIALAEKCGETLVCHIEKALYSHAGVYPAMVQKFADCYGGDCRWINREDDGRDRGLRTSKLQYLPAELGGKLRFEVGCELDALRHIPELTTERLTLSPFTDDDKAAYNALCLDDDRNRWWGYDYRDDLKGELTEDYFLDVTRQDFASRIAINFAVRLEGRCIGEVVLYNGDWRGTMEQGCRIAPAFAGHGYGTEAFAAVADWALYHLGLTRVVAKCYQENAASERMLSACMRHTHDDETFRYFEKLV